MTTLEQAQTRNAWDAIATGYDDFVTPSHMWLGNEGLRRAELRPGMRFLDVAAGSGALSIPAARLGARMLATDMSPVMLERLRRRAREEALDIETGVMDGHALELQDDTFDLAGSQFGVMLFPDMPRGIGEMARVVKPGGCAASWPRPAWRTSASTRSPRRWSSGPDGTSGTGWSTAIRSQERSSPS